MKVEKTYSGVDAIRAALTKQEGTFPRQATYLMNPVKDTLVKRSETNNEKAATATLRHERKEAPKKDSSDNEKAADALMHRNPLGRFAKN